jgi:hypothetical protein
LVDSPGQTMAAASPREPQMACRTKESAPSTMPQATVRRIAIGGRFCSGADAETWSRPICVHTAVRMRKLIVTAIRSMNGTRLIGVSSDFFPPFPEVPSSSPPFARLRQPADKKVPRQGASSGLKRVDEELQARVRRQESRVRPRRASSRLWTLASSLLLAIASLTPPLGFAVSAGGSAAPQGVGGPRRWSRSGPGRRGLRSGGHPAGGAPIRR